MAPREALQIGELVDGKYEIVRELGAGAMGVVYVARHQALRRQVAVKILRGQLAADPELSARFEQEARAASAIGHPNIIDVYDLGRTADGVLFMVMELLEGDSLAGLLERHRRLPLARAQKLVDQVLAALSAAHRAGIVHRDLKPDNVFVVSSEYRADFVKLLDFGISKILAREPAQLGESKKGTALGTVMGTPEYMSPEQARGLVDQVDARTDVYAAGVVLYELLCGRTPFQGDNYNAVMAAIIDGTYPRPRELAPGVPATVEAVIVKALSYRREDRWQSAAAMREALELAVAEGLELDDGDEAGAGAGAGAGGAGDAPVLELDEAPVAAAAAGRPAVAATIPLSQPGIVPVLPRAPTPPPVAAGTPPPRPVTPPPRPVTPPPGPVTPPPVSAAAPPAPLSASFGPPLLVDDDVPAAKAPAAAPPRDAFSAPDEIHAGPLVIDTLPLRAPPSRAMDRPAVVTPARAAPRGGRSGGGAGRWLVGLVVVVALAGGGAWAFLRYRDRLPAAIGGAPAAVAVEIVVMPSGAETALDGQPFAGGVVRLTREEHWLEVRAPGYVPRRVALKPEVTPRLEVRLVRTLAPIGAREAPLAASDVAGAGDGEGAGVATASDVDAALGKLAQARGCVAAVGEELARTQGAMRAARPGAEGVVDVNLHFAVDGAVACLQGVRKAEPRLGGVDGAAATAAAALARVSRALDKVGGADQRARDRKAWKELGAALDEALEAERALAREIAVADQRWQQAALTVMQRDGGKTTGWLLRRYAVAAIAEQRVPRRKGTSAAFDAFYTELYEHCRAAPSGTCPAPVMAAVNRYYQERTVEAANALVNEVNVTMVE
jgi:serine/threonine-protein kinase